MFITENLDAHKTNDSNDTIRATISFDVNRSLSWIFSSVLSLTEKKYIDLSGYAKKTEIPTKVSQLTNDKNYLTSIPSEYVTDSELNAKGYATGGYVDSKIAGIVIPTVPTKISAFENDKGYLTQHQDISGKADKVHKHSMSDITDYVAPTIPSLDGYATEQYVTNAITTAFAGIATAEGGSY